MRTKKVKLCLNNVLVALRNRCHRGQLREQMSCCELMGSAQCVQITKMMKLLETVPELIDC
jgi:hypothetical protein